MGKTLFATNKAARELLKEAESICGTSLGSLIMDGPLETLTKPSVAQPAILTTSLAFYEANGGSASNNCKVMLGHSLGEYTALTASGAISFAEAVSLVQRRGLAMEECCRNPNLLESGFAMSALILTPKGKNEFPSFPLDIISFINDPKHSWNSGKDWVNVANINSSSQVVLSGTKNG